MQINMLYSKIHRARVTDANLNYVGSISIDKELIKDGKVNGNTSSALEYATDVKHKIEDFYTHQGVNNLR